MYIDHVLVFVFLCVPIIISPISGSCQYLSIQEGSPCLFLLFVHVCLTNGLGQQSIVHMPRISKLRLPSKERLELPIDLYYMYSIFSVQFELVDLLR